MADKPAVSVELLRAGLTTAAEVLAQNHVNYAVIGGMAAGYRSQPRFTKDVDFLLNIPQLGLPPVLDELVGRGFSFDLLTTIREWTQEHMTVLSYHGIRIDWLKPVIPAYQHVLERATEETWFEHRIRVASAEGLILLKLLAFRTQDQVDIENLVAAHRDHLDLAWIQAEWQTLAGLDDPRMQRFLEMVG
jgi:nucleotidyltransferase AbiEii toxin of type IV toxin-antitoxin system